MLVSNPIHIAQLLQSTFIGTTQLIRQAQQQLKQLHGDPHFLDNLLQICKQSSHPYNIRKSAMLYTLTYCKNMQSKFTQQSVLNMAKFLFLQLSENMLQYNLRRHLISTIQYLVVNFDKNCRVKAVLYKECVEKCASASESGDRGLIVYVGLAIQAVLSISVHSTRELSQFIRSSILNFCQITLNLYRIIQELLVNEEQSQQLSEMQTSIQHRLQILKIYSLGFKLYIKKMSYLDVQTVKCIYEQKMCEIFRKQWQLKIAQNLIATNLIYYTRFRNRSLEQQLHSIKADYIQCLGITIKIVFQYFKDIDTVSKHPIVGNLELVNILISATSSLLQICPHYNITSYSLIKLLEEILNCLIIAARTKYYTKMLETKKKQLLEQTIFPILLLSKSDYYKLESDPQQLINQIMQIIDMDPKEFQNNRKKQNQIVQEYEDIEDYKSLRTVASTLLFQYCKCVDNVVVEILAFSQKVLEGTFGKFNKNLVLTVLCILRVHICHRNQEGTNLLIYLITRLQQTPMPPLLACSNTQSELQRQQNLQYMLTLLCIHKYLQKISILDSTFVKKLGNKLREIMQSDQIESAIKIIAYDMVRILLQRYQHKDSTQISLFVGLANRLLIAASDNSDKILQMIFNLYKIFDEEIATNSQTIVDTLTNLFTIIDKQVKNRDVGDMNIIIKCWNIITDLCQNQRIVQVHNQTIQLMLLSLCQIFLSYPALDYTEYLLLSLNSLLQFHKKTSEAVLKTFTCIFSVFETVFKLQFTSQSFETINLIILYLPAQQDPTYNEIKKNILQICLLGINTKYYGNQSRSWNDCLPAALVLQNFVIRFCHSFNIDVWHLLAKQVLSRVDELQHNLFKSNVVATIGLMLMQGSTYFNQNQQNILLEKLIQHSPSLRDKHSLKTTIISLCNIILNQCFTCQTFTLLAILSQNLYNLEQGQNYEQQPKQYEQYLGHIKNSVTQTNQNNSIKNLINQLKINDLHKFQSVVNAMEQQKATFLKKFMNTAKVNNNTRQILRIKR